MATKSTYTYEDAGFNGFLQRSLKSNSQAQTLAMGPTTGATSTINFDQMQTSGSIAQDMKIGANLELQGSKGRMAVKDDQRNEVGWAGNLNP